MNGGYELYVLRRLAEDAEASRRHEGEPVRRVSRLRRWLSTRRSAMTTTARPVARIPRQASSPENLDAAGSPRTAG